MPRFTLDAMRAAQNLPGAKVSLCVSRQNESFSAFSAFGDDVVGMDTFSSYPGALFAAWRIPLLRRRLAREIRRRRIDVVVELMGHVWSSMLASAIRGAGARYVTVAHDADAHLGDATSLVKGILDLTLVRADHVITLSEVVAEGVRHAGRVPPERITTLFHPDLTYGLQPRRTLPATGEPLRLLFFGRLLPYKGLALFVGAVEALRAAGHRIEAGVFGEGDIGAEAARLAAMGAEVVNRWLSEDEIATVLRRYDVMVVSHVQASQSGVVATAFGAGLPVVATPVGGLMEQVQDGVTGLVATDLSAEALAAAIERLVLDPTLYTALCDGVLEHRDSRSMRRFVVACVGLARESLRHPLSDASARLGRASGFF